MATAKRPEPDQEGLWPGIRFEDDEYLRRHRRLTEALASADVGTLLVSDERTTWYLTGFGTGEPIGSLARPRVVVADREGNITFHVHESTARCVAEMLAPGVELRPYPELGAPTEELADDLRSRGGDGWGADLDESLASRLGAGTLMSLAERTGSQPRDLSDLIWDLRAVKSAAELARLWRACEITSQAYEELFPSTRTGDTEAEIADRMCSLLVELGGEGAWANCVTGQGEYGRVDGVPRNRRVESGELVFIDAGARVGGYWADFSRSAVCGGPSDHQMEMQAKVERATAAGVAALRPGNTLADVSDVIDEVMAAEGITFNNRPGRYGHSLGMDITEPPNLAGGVEVELQAGMVITVEPATLDEFGIYHCEQNVAVSEEGPELLSLFPTALSTLT